MEDTKDRASGTCRTITKGLCHWSSRTREQRKWMQRHLRKSRLTLVQEWWKTWTYRSKELRKCPTRYPGSPHSSGSYSNLLKTKNVESMQGKRKVHYLRGAMIQITVDFSSHWDRQAACVFGVNTSLLQSPAWWPVSRHSGSELQDIKISIETIITWNQNSASACRIYYPAFPQAHSLEVVQAGLMLLDFSFPSVN